MSLIWNNRDENQSSLFKLQFLRKFSSKEIFAGKIFSKEIGKIQSNSRNLRGRFSWNPHTVYYICGVQYRAPPVDFTFRYFGLKGKKKKKEVKKKKKNFDRRRVTTVLLASGEGRKIVKIQRRGTGLSYFSHRARMCSWIFICSHPIIAKYLRFHSFSPHVRRWTVEQKRVKIRGWITRCFSPSSFALIATRIMELQDDQEVRLADRIFFFFLSLLNKHMIT